MSAPKLTKAQWHLLQFAQDKTGVYVARVAVARALERRGLVSVEDFGIVKFRGRSDGERWFVRVTDAGRAALKEST